MKLIYKLPEIHQLKKLVSYWELICCEIYGARDSQDCRKAIQIGSLSTPDPVLVRFSSHFRTYPDPNGNLVQPTFQPM